MTRLVKMKSDQLKLAFLIQAWTVSQVIAVILELDGPSGLLLHHHGPRGHQAAMGNVRNPEFDQIAGTKLGIDRQIEKRQVTDLVA